MEGLRPTCCRQSGRRRDARRLLSWTSMPAEGADGACWTSQPMAVFQGGWVGGASHPTTQTPLWGLVAFVGPKCPVFFGKIGVRQIGARTFSVHIGSARTFVVHSRPEPQPGGDRD